MKNMVFVSVLLLTLGSCGTASGVVSGAGNVFEGMAEDARTLGSWID